MNKKQNRILHILPAHLYPLPDPPQSTPPPGSQSPAPTESPAAPQFHAANISGKSTPTPPPTPPPPPPQNPHTSNFLHHRPFPYKPPSLFPRSSSATPSAARQYSSPTSPADAAPHQWQLPSRSPPPNPSDTHTINSSISRFPLISVDMSRRGHLQSARLKDSFLRSPLCLLLRALFEKSAHLLLVV